MKHSRVLSVFAALGAAALLAGCGSAEAAAPSGADEASLTVGLIQGARPEVDAWAAAWQTAAEKVMAADPSVEFTDIYDATDPTAAEPLMRQMLDGGADVLVMSHYVLADVARQLATEYPDVPMVVSAFGEPQQDNLWLATASYLEIGYSTCWLLTSLSDDGRIGLVRSDENIPDDEVAVGCQLGATAADPDATVDVVWTNSQTDEQANIEQTQRLFDDGITEIFHGASPADAAGLNLCEQLGGHCATWGGDARDYAPTAGVMSVQADWSIVIDKLIEQARTGVTKAEFWGATLGNGGLFVQPFEGESAADISPELQAEFTAMVAALASEEIELPESIAHPGIR